MTIANNYITGGAGIWYGTSMYEDPNPFGIHWCYTQYFLNVYNNYINAWGNPWFLSAHASTIGPATDGGINVAQNPDYPASLAYGIRIINNHVEAPNDFSDPANPIYGNNLWVKYVVNPDGTWSATGGTMPVVPDFPQYLQDAARAAGGAKPWWAYEYTNWTRDEREQILHYMRWVPNNGIYIGGEASGAPYPGANGEIVDGNVVTNEMNGVYLGSQAWNTVVRNNQLTGNNVDEYRGIDTSVQTTVLDGGNGTPGYKMLASIDKSALTVNKSALSAAITTADVNFETALVSVDGSDIVITQDWVTQAVKTAYQNAIGTARVALNDANACDLPCLYEFYLDKRQNCMYNNFCGNIDARD